MKHSQETTLFLSLVSDENNETDGLQAAQDLLQKAVLHQAPTWESALSFLASSDPDLAQATVIQAVNDHTVSAFVQLFSSPDKQLRSVAEKALVQIAGNGSQVIAQTVRAAIQEKYGLRDEQVEAILKNGKSVIEYLCPFVMRKNETLDFHLDEVVNEPDDRPTAAHISAWVYRNGKEISHLVVSGHANHAVCKEVSAKIAATSLRLGKQPNESLFITGAGLLIRPKGQKPAPSKSGITEPPLEDLVKQLKDVEAQTGMLTLYEVSDSTYDQVCDSLETLIKKHSGTSKPVLVRHENKEVKARTVFLPFYDLTQASPQPLKLELSIEELGPDFPKLLELHTKEYIYEMEADAKRRRAIYADWLANDQNGLLRLVHEMFQRIASVMGLPESESSALANQYYELLMSDEKDQNTPWAANQTLEGRHMLMPLRAKRLLQFIQTHTKRGALVQSMQLLQFQAALQLIQKPEYPVRGMRNFADASVQDGQREYNLSLQEQVEWNLPGLIKSDERWLTHMDEILEQIDTNDPKRRARAEADNLQLFADSFLRGWPSIFLSSETQRARYDQWCQTYRQKTWQSIQDQLFSRGMRMEPLASDNVIFNVRRLSPDKLEITPYYLANQRTFLVMIHPGFGMTFYINPWQYRKTRRTAFQTTAKKREAYFQIFEKSLAQLAQGEYEQALDGFKQSLRFYPITAGEALIHHYWQENYRDSQQEFQALSELASAFMEFEHNPAASSKVFSHFIEEYPDFLADPYLYLGFYKHKNATQFFRTKHEFQSLIETRQFMIDDLIKAGTLVPVQSHAGGQATSYNVIGGSYMTQQRIAELNQQKEELDQFSEQLKIQEQTIWNDLKQSPNKYIQHAMRLNNTLVSTAFQSQRLGFSTQYDRLIRPLHNVLRAQSFMKIFFGLTETFYKKGDDLIEKLKKQDSRVQRKVLDQLEDMVSTYSAVPYLFTDDLKPINNLREFLERLQTVDSITRENLIRHQFDEVLHHCLRNANRTYYQAASIDNGLTEVRRQYTDCLGYTTRFKDTIKSLIDRNRIVLQNGLAGTSFQVLETKPLQCKQLKLDQQEHMIAVIAPNGQGISVLSVSPLDKETTGYLESELAEKNFLVQFQGCGLRPPYALLYTPMQAPPLLERWQRLISDLSPWLLHSLAHLGILPLRDKEINREETFLEFDEKDVVDQISVDLDDACRLFLKNVDSQEPVEIVLN